MKYLFLLLLLTGCTAPRVETKKQEAGMSSSLEAFVPKTKEDLDKLRIPVPSYEVLNRLIRTQSNEDFILYTQDGGTDEYLAIYIDMENYDYYVGKIESTNYPPHFIDSLLYNHITNYPLDNEDRFVVISNLSPSSRVILDAGYFPQYTNLYVQILRKTPDPYYWDEFEYVDDEGNEGQMYNINNNLFPGEKNPFTTRIFYLPKTNTAEYWPLYYMAYTNISAPAITQDHIIRARYGTGDIMGFAASYPEGRFQ